MDEKDLEKGCFNPNWLEFEPVKKHKDLATLLGELEEIKQNIEVVEAKRLRLANLMKFYSGDLLGQN